MAQIENRIAEFLKSLNFFSGLPGRDINIFLDAANVRVCPKGTSVFHQGDSADSFFVIISGWVKLYRNTPEGEEALAGLLTRGDVFGETALFPKTSYSLSAQAAEETRLLSIPGSVLRERAQKNPEITMRMMSALSQEMRNLQRQNEQMAIMSAPQRVACLLLQFSSHLVGNGGTVTFPYDKSLAAARLGIKPETFSRALAQLIPLGVKIKGPEIKISSFAKLIAFSCGHCTALPGECRGSRQCAACPLKEMQAAA